MSAQFSVSSINCRSVSRFRRASYLDEIKLNALDLKEVSLMLHAASMT